MLAVDRKQGGAAGLCGLGHQVASGDQCFLVGKSDGLSRLDGRHGRPQPCTAYDRRHDEIGVTRCCFYQRIGASGRAATTTLKRIFQVAKPSLVRDDRKLGIGPSGCVGERVHVHSRRQGRDLELVGRSLDEVERRFPDRAGAAENCDFLHAKPAACAAKVRTATGTRPSRRSRRPPCPGSQDPEILDPGGPLHLALEQIAGLRGNGEQRCEWNQGPVEIR